MPRNEDGLKERIREVRRVFKEHIDKRLAVPAADMKSHRLLESSARRRRVFAATTTTMEHVMKLTGNNLREKFQQLEEHHIENLQKIARLDVTEKMRSNLFKKEYEDYGFAHQQLTSGRINAK